MSGALRSKLLVQSAKRLFQPLNIVPRGAEVKREVLPKCQRLMLDMGILGHGSNGMYHLLPLGYRALHKLERLIDSHLEVIGAQRIQMPILTKSEVWKSTSRYDTMGPELFKVLDRHGKEYLLSPTHEEAIAEFLSSVAPLSHNQLPLMMYQVTQKFRDEMKPRCGLLKSREFVMKDLYSFDRSPEDAEISYGAISTAYGNIFDEIGVPYVKVAGSTGMMGGVFSHEYQILAEIGEDRLRVCGKCGTGSNLELAQEEDCKGCGGKLEERKGIEVAHTFLLGAMYSQNLGATFKSEKGGIEPLVMASYGIGLTRVLAACVEYLSLPDQLRWPISMVPYSLVVVPPKDGSKESPTASQILPMVLASLERLPLFHRDVLLDDRGNLTIGKRVLQAKKSGYPYILVLGSKLPQVELIDTYRGTAQHLNVKEFYEFFTKREAIPSDKVQASAVR